MPELRTPLGKLGEASIASPPANRSASRLSALFSLIALIFLFTAVHWALWYYFDIEFDSQKILAEVATGDVVGVIYGYLPELNKRYLRRKIRFVIANPITLKALVASVLATFVIGAVFNRSKIIVPVGQAEIKLDGKKLESESWTEPSIGTKSVYGSPVELLVDKTHFAHGTGFIWKHADTFHLVTAWHNLSGQNPFTGRHLNDGGRVPNTIRSMPCTLTTKGDQTEITRHPIAIPLYEHFDQPLWRQHEDFATNRADIATLPPPTGDLDYAHVNRYKFEPLFTHIGADLLIAGYPYSSYEGPMLPIWKRGSLASEPGFGWQNRPAFLIDAASRPGMSGSPVFRRVFGPAAFSDGQGGYITRADNVMTSEFLGVYAGHLTAQDANVTIGYAWYGALIDEILDDPAAGTRL
jgi:hypothetical protein